MKRNILKGTLAITRLNQKTQNRIVKRLKRTNNPIDNACFLVDI